MGFIKRAFGGRKGPVPPQLPAQPTPQEVDDIIDEISGVQSVTVTLPNGRKQRVIKRIRQTPEEEAMFKRANEIIARSVDNIQRLYQYDPTSVVNYQPFIETFSNINQERMNDLAQIGDFADIANKVNAFKTMSRGLADREFDIRSRMNDEMLAKRGLQDSTIAAENKAAMARERALFEQQAAHQAEAYGDDLMRRQLDRESGLYDIREAGRTGRLDQAQAAYTLERQKKEEEERNRQNLLNENQAMIATAQASRGDPQASVLGLNLNNSAQNAAHNQNVVMNQRYNNEINRLGRQHQMDVDAFSRRPARFGRALLNTGLQAAGTYFGGPIGGAIGSAAGSGIG